MALAQPYAGSDRTQLTLRLQSGGSGASAKGDLMTEAYAARPDFRGWAAVIPALMAALGLAACGGETEQGPTRPALVMVERPVTEDETPQAISLPGRIEAVNQAQLAFQADGRLVRFHVREGERVRAGDILAELDDADYVLRLREIEIAERTAAADLERRRQLRDEGILSPAAVEQAEANHASARAERQAIERQVSYTRLTAPYDGMVGRRLEEVGAVIGAGQPVLSMIDSEAIDVAVNVPAGYALRMPFNDRLIATGRVLGVGEEIELTLAYAEHSTVPDEASRTYRLILRGLPPPDINLLPGMAMRVTIPESEPSGLASDERLIPASSVFSQPDGRSAVWIVDGENRARRVVVDVRRMDGERARIAAGLPRDALVVVAGGHKLSEGQPVQPRRRGD